MYTLNRVSKLKGSQFKVQYSSKNNQIICPKEKVSADHPTIFKKFQISNFKIQNSKFKIQKSLIIGN